MKSGRVAVGLLCALAVCCALLFVASDGEGSVEFVAQAKDNMVWPNKLGKLSIESTDVEKVGVIYSQTPDGRVRLLDYFHKLEKLIAKEVSSRRADIISVRAQIARNQAYNMAARKKMKAAMLKRIAANAKEAQHKLTLSMRHTTQRFAVAHEMGNKRNIANIKRSKRTREIMRKNKAQGAHSLRQAVIVMQRALASTSQAVNHRIKALNPHIAANAAMIRHNARVARQNLSKAMNRFNHKMNNANSEAAKGQSKLAVQAAAMTKRTRALIQQQINTVAYSTAAQFAKVRSQMAKDRHRADMLVTHATSRLEAALNANRVLENKRFAKTVGDIAAAKSEARKRIAAARSEFKVGLLNLGSVVKHQVTKLNGRVTQLSAVVTQNKLEQDKINRNVNAETKRMIRLGNQRYKAQLKSDAQISNLMKRNQKDVSRRMKRMATSFNAKMNSIRKRAKRDRAHAAHMLATRTSQVYQTLKAVSMEQEQMHKKLVNFSRRARMNVMAKMRETKRNFAMRLAKLNTVAVQANKRANKRIEKLTGVVASNAMKDRKGRALLKYQMKSSRLEISTAIRSAMHKGEQRALKLMKHMRGMNKKTTASLNQKIVHQIAHLAKQTKRSIEGVRLESKEARAAMKKEILYAVRSAAKAAKQNLAAAVKHTQRTFIAVRRGNAAAARRGAAARARLTRRLAANHRAASQSIRYAVAAQTSALLSLKVATQKKIKKTNLRVDAAARRMEANAKAARAKMRANLKALTSKVNSARSEAKKLFATVDAASAARKAAALKEIRNELSKAKKKESAKFSRFYVKMAKNRAAVDRQLAGMTGNMNNQLAKQAALNDARFKKTVKDINKAKAAAYKAVSDSRKAFTTALAGVTAQVKAQETRISGEIAVVTGMVMSNRAQQAAINRRVNAELKKTVRIADKRQSEAKRARGKMRHIMNAHKKAAAEEVKALSKYTVKQVGKIRHQAAKWRRQAAIDLTKSTKKLFAKMARAKAAQDKINKRLTAANQRATVANLAAVKKVRNQFNTRVVSLANTVAANGRRFAYRMKKLTGVYVNAKKAHYQDMKLLKEQRKSMQTDLNKAISRSVQLGAARAKAVYETQTAKLTPMKKMLEAKITSATEAASDKVYKMLHTKRKEIADNYLSVKAYAAAAGAGIIQYVAKANGRGLSAIGDFLVCVQRVSKVPAKMEQGVGNGLPRLQGLFGGKGPKVSNMVNKMNFLANEYTKIVTLLKARWPLGIGKYLIARMEESMQKKGILKVDRMAGRSGNYVFVAGHTVGLSSKLAALSKLAAPVKKYQGALKHLTRNLDPKKKKVSKFFRVAPPEWQGQ